MTALVLVGTRLCPACRLPTRSYRLEQPALFRHAGFGATIRSTIRWCLCGWALLVDSTEVRPL